MKKLGRYDLVRVLGKGAMGIVYEGRDPNLDRRVAIKTVKVENLSHDAAAEYEARFRTEARSAARLQHPNIVSVYDSDRDGDVAFLVMEFIQGDDLKHHLDSGKRYSLEESVRMICELLDALDYAHRQSIVHRDIKPANLLLEPGGRVKLTDFGVARIQDAGEATRTQGAIIGTLKYMAPEQVRGTPVDARADIFSAGVVLYQLLADKRPFDGENDFSIIHQIISQIPEPPSTFHDQLPTAIDAVVSRALAKDREQRFQTAGDFQRALRKALTEVADTTIVPPANPRRAEGGASTLSRGTSPSSATSGLGGSSGTSGTSGTSGSTVTQELELVYWKDIKDSTDSDELRGFLDRFPTGIYADLARRRLKKLSEAPSADSTMAGPVAATARVAVHDDDITRMPSRVAGPPAERREPLPPGASLSDIQPSADEVAGASTDSAGASAGPAGQPAGSKRNLMIAGAAVAVVLVAGAVFMGTRGASPAKTGPGADAPLAAASAAASAPPVAAASAASAAASSVASAASAAASAAPIPSRMASALAGLKAKAQDRFGAQSKASAPAPVSPPSTPAPAVVEAPKPSVATATQAPPVAAKPASPNDACEGRMLLGFQFCMAEQCAKPVFQNHPVCVERREMERRRRDAQQGNN